MGDELQLPSSLFSYIFNIAGSSIPKLLLIILASTIAAFRADLFASSLNGSGRRDLPVEICFYSEDNGDFRGDRICNNALANAIVSILVALVLMMIDLMIPCLTAVYVRLAGIFGMVWTGLMAVYWCITASLLSDLYRKYCDSGDFVCSDTRPKRFIILPILGNICMVGWIIVGLISLLRVVIKK
ncbi:uncharacterized protein [Dysidea avara]|uniref:uncharacterized protein n=1 Tax=Dysidea avara TaxID=196820 RepID=UPI00332D76CF